MLKERFEKTKKFVKDNKFEIVGGCLFIATSVIGFKVAGKFIKAHEIAKNKENAKRLWYDAYDRAADIANNILIPEINEKYKEYDFSLTDELTQSVYDTYLKEYEESFNNILAEELAKVVDVKS